MCKVPFVEDLSPCGHPIYEADMTDWIGFGFPHPVTGDRVPPEDRMKFTWIDEEAPNNKYGVSYMVMALPDGTYLRLLND